ncbi:hypothetical protein EON67_10935 [archaeon]|nr:MAG: hypothetical protein EON67_10935 [archaeon]
MCAHTRALERKCVSFVAAPMMPDAEVLSVAAEILRSLPIGEFTIKLNHRGVLDAVLEICGVPASKVRAAAHGHV